MMDISKTFCILPWMHLFVSEPGEVYPCCIVPESNPPLLNNAGKTIKIDQVKSFDEIFNSNQMKKIREMMMKGEKPEVCMRCYKLEGHGLASHRQGSNHIFSNIIQEQAQKTKIDGAIDLSLYSADIRLGNKCNLSCRMCSPTSSKNLISEWTALHPEQSGYYQQLKNIDWFEGEKFWNEIENSKQIERMHFAGGEPLLIEKHYDFLEKLVQKDLAKNMTLSYNTNLTVLPERALKLWDQFKKIQIMVSIDGFDEVNKYIRYPTNWDILTKNLKKTEEQQVNTKKFFLTLNTTVQVYNIFNLTKLIDFCINETKVFNFPILNPLFYPEELSIQILPTEIKKQIEKNLKIYLDENLEKLNVRYAKSGYYTDHITKSIEGIITFMNQEDKSILLPQFKKHTLFLDESRKQSFSKVCPELSGLI